MKMSRRSVLASVAAMALAAGAPCVAAATPAQPRSILQLDFSSGTMCEVTGRLSREFAIAFQRHLWPGMFTDSTKVATKSRADFFQLLNSRGGRPILIDNRLRECRQALADTICEFDNRPNALMYFIISDGAPEYVKQG